MSPHPSALEVYGTPGQQLVLRRGRALFDLLSGDPGYGYYGRGVGLITRQDGPLIRLCRLVQAQGASHYSDVPGVEVPGLREEIESTGFAVTLFRRWTGGAEALVAARQVADEVAFPDGLTQVRIDRSSPPGVMAAFCDAASSAGVLTLAGDVQRGVSRPAVTLALTDSAGRVVSCAASSQYAQSRHPTHGGEFWWGMLATRSEARGRRLSLALGARALLEAHERYGAVRFFTGVQEGNAASEAVCRRMGLTLSGGWVLSVTDPEALGGAALTR